MREVGIVATVLVIVVVVAAVVTAVMSIPDLKRYLRIRSM